jgi:hypothetical protein
MATVACRMSTQIDMNAHLYAAVIFFATRQEKAARKAWPPIPGRHSDVMLHGYLGSLPRKSNFLDLVPVRSYDVLKRGQPRHQMRLKIQHHLSIVLDRKSFHMEFIH